MPRDLTADALRDLRFRRERAASQLEDRRRELARVERRRRELEDLIDEGKRDLDRLDDLIERAEDDR